VLIKVSVLDGDDGLLENGRHILRGEFVALEDAACGKQQAIARLHAKRAWGRLRYQSAACRQTENAIADIADRNGDESRHGKCARTRNEAAS
jgi:hypothetical protein